MTGPRVWEPETKRERTLRGAHVFLRRSLWIYAAVLPSAILPLMGSYSPALLAKMLVILALANHTLAGGKGRESSLKRVSFAWVLLALVSYAWSAAPGVTIELGISLFLNVLVVVALCRLTEEEIRTLLPPLVGSTAALALFVLAAPAQVDRDGRAGVGGVDENVTALVLAVGFAAAFALIFEAKKAARVVYVLFAIPMLAAIFHLGSRSGVVAVLLAGAVISVATLRVSLDRLVLRAMALGVLLVAGIAFTQYLLASDLVPARINRLFEDPSSLDDSDRSKIVGLFLNYQDQWWVTGVGYGADADFLRSSSGIYKNVHNQFWSSWVELGLLGIVLLGVLAWCWIRFVIGRGRPPWVLALAVPVMVFAITLGVDKTDTFWFCLGITAALMIAHRQRVAGTGRE